MFTFLYLYTSYKYLIFLKIFLHFWIVFYTSTALKLCPVPKNNFLTYSHLSEHQ